MTSPVDMQSVSALVFTAAGQRYALPIDRVREVQQIVAFAEVPDETGKVIGMIDIRGEIVPAIDFRMLLGLSPERYTLETPMIVACSSRGPVALVVEAVDTVVDLPTSSAEPLPAIHPLAPRMLGVYRLGDALAFLLDVDALLEQVALLDVARTETDE